MSTEPLHVEPVVTAASAPPRRRSTGALIVAAVRSSRWVRGLPCACARPCRRKRSSPPSATKSPRPPAKAAARRRRPRPTVVTPAPETVAARGAVRRHVAAGAREPISASRSAGRLAAIRVRLGDRVARRPDAGDARRDRGRGAGAGGRGAGARRRGAAGAAPDDSAKRTSTLVGSGAASQQSGVQTGQQRALAAAQLDSARAQLALAQATLENHTLTGAVRRRRSRRCRRAPARSSDPGTPLFHVQDTSTVKLRGDRSARPTRRWCRPGAPLEVRLDGRACRARWSRCSASVDAGHAARPRRGGDRRTTATTAAAAASFVRAVGRAGSKPAGGAALPASALRPGSQDELHGGRGTAACTRATSLFATRADGVAAGARGLDADETVVAGADGRGEGRRRDRAPRRCRRAGYEDERTVNLSAIAIRRPVFTVMVTVALLVLGFMGFTRLGTDLFPDVSFPVVAVNIVYPGAEPARGRDTWSPSRSRTRSSASTASTACAPSRARASRRRSSSSSSASTSPRRPRRCASASRRSRYKLPHEVKEPIDQPLRRRARRRSSPTRCAAPARSRETRKFADDVIKPALEQVDGVASVEVKGGAEREIHVDLDRARARRARPRPERDRAAAARRKPHRARRPLRRGHARDQRAHRRRARDRRRGARPHRRHRARTARRCACATSRSVEDGFEELRTRVRVNGEEAVTLRASSSSRARTPSPSPTRCKAKLGAAREGVPAGHARRRSSSIRRASSSENVARGRGRDRLRRRDGDPHHPRSSCSTCARRSISAVALPTSVIGTFFVMYVLGYTLNMMTLLGLSLAIGLLIDDAVVVRENIFKHLERGKPPTQAALDGTKEIALSRARDHADHRRGVHAGRVHEGHRRAVLPPVRHHHLGRGADLAVRRLHARPDAVVALLEAARRTAGRSLRAGSSGRSSASSTAWTTPTAAILGWAVRHKLVVGAARASAASSSWAASRKLMGNEFVNAEDRGQFVVDVELPAGTSLDETDARRAARPRRSCSTHPRGQDGVRDASAPTARSTRRAGASSPRPSTSARRRARRRSRTCARKAVAAACPSAKVVVTDPPFVEGAATEAPIMIDVRGADATTTIAPLAEQGRRDPADHAGRAGRAGEVHAGPPRAARRGRSRSAPPSRASRVAQVAMALRTAMEGDEATQAASGQGRDPDPRAPARRATAPTPDELARPDAADAARAGQARRRRDASSAARARR